MPDIAEIFAGSRVYRNVHTRQLPMYWVLYAVALAGRRPGLAWGRRPLVLVLVADAGVTPCRVTPYSMGDGIIVVTTVVGWSRADRVVITCPPCSGPQRICLVRDGRIIVSGLEERAHQSWRVDGAIMAEGAGHLAKVKRAYLESTGEFSVISVDEDTRPLHVGRIADDAPGAKASRKAAGTLWCAWITAIHVLSTAHRATLWRRT